MEAPIGVAGVKIKTNVIFGIILKFLKLSTYALTFFLFTPLMMNWMLINRYQSDKKVNMKSLEISLNCLDRRQFAF